MSEDPCYGNSTYLCDVETYTLQVVRRSDVLVFRNWCKLILLETDVHNFLIVNIKSVLQNWKNSTG